MSIIDQIKNFNEESQTYLYENRIGALKENFSDKFYI